MDDPKLLADKNVHTKVSDVYNVILSANWRKSNLSLANKKIQSLKVKRCHVTNKMGGKAIIQRFCKNNIARGHHECDNEGDEQPLILAICTPFMSRVHQHIYQFKEWLFGDASSSFEDFNIPPFIMSIYSISC